MSNKRYSFKEPESEDIRRWISEQKPLGKSLEFIIADAIKKYGFGDVITNMLSDRAEAFANGDDYNFDSNDTDDHGLCPPVTPTVYGKTSKESSIFDDAKETSAFEDDDMEDEQQNTVNTLLGDTKLI